MRFLPASISLLLLTPVSLPGQQPTRLDTVTITAIGDNAGFIHEFEERRVRGTGKFITAKEMRAFDDRSFVDVLRTRFSGLAMQTGAEGTFLYSRGQQPPRALLDNAGKPCFVQVVMDGVMVYSMGPADASPPDVAELLTRNFDAAEYYSSGSTTPPEYRSTGAICGTIILWSRRQ